MSFMILTVICLSAQAQAVETLNTPHSPQGEMQTLVTSHGTFGGALQCLF